MASKDAPSTARPAAGFWAQFMLLTRKNVQLYTRNRRTLMSYLLTPAIVCLILWIFQVRMEGVRLEAGSAEMGRPRVDRHISAFHISDSVDVASIARLKSCLSPTPVADEGFDGRVMKRAIFATPMSNPVWFVLIANHRVLYLSLFLSPSLSPSLPPIAPSLSSASLSGSLLIIPPDLDGAQRGVRGHCVRRPRGPRGDGGSGARLRRVRRRGGLRGPGMGRHEPHVGGGCAYCSAHGQHRCVPYLRGAGRRSARCGSHVSPSWWAPSGFGM